MSPKTKFSEGEKVLCFHGPLIYEAKCLRVQFKEKEKMYKYLVHYAGWNKNWDEWVAESRILKLNEQSLARQKDLLKSHEANVQKKKAQKKAAEKKKEAAKSSRERQEDRSGEDDSRSSTPSTDRSSGGTKRPPPPSEGEGGEGGSKRPRVEGGVETEEQSLSSVEVRIRLPEELKPLLVDDWASIHRNHKLAVLPARVPVAAILEDYRRARAAAKGNTPNKESAVVETVAGLREYFDMMLGKQLLYKYERGQYGDLCGDASPSEIYGYIHLVRMFVKLGEMLAFTQLDEKSSVMLHYHLQDFLKFLAKSSSSYHSPQDYVVASAEYQRRML